MSGNTNSNQLGSTPNIVGDFSSLTAQAIAYLNSLGFGGMTIGNAVSGGAARSVLFEDAAQKLGADSTFTYNNTSGSLFVQAHQDNAIVLQLKRNSALTTADYLRILDEGGAPKAGIDNNGAFYGNPGTESQFYNQSTNRMMLGLSNGSAFARFNDSGIGDLWYLDAASMRIVSGRQMGFSSSSTSASTAADAAIKRVAASIIQPTDGGSNKGWINEAGGANTASAPTNATTAFSNLSDFSVNIISGRKYSGYLLIFAKDSTGADGLKFDFNGGGATVANFLAGFVGTPLGATVGVNFSQALATALTLTAVSTTSVAIMIAFSFTASSSGTFIPRFAQNAHSTGTATIEQSSSIVMTDIT